MFVYAGIDEAGYGPMLGPLCVACTTFVIPGHDPDLVGGCDLWKRLKKSICRKRTDKKRRIAIDDSKKLKLANDSAAHPLRFLERGVLSFLSVMNKPGDGASDALPDFCNCDDELFNRLNITMSPADWYRSSTALPVTHTLDELRICISRLRKTLSEQSVSFELLRCEAIDAEAFNTQCEMMGTKSSVNFCAVMRHIDAIWRRWPQHHPRVIVDRQGGRSHYLQDLLLAYPDAQIQILAEDDNLSRYRLERPDGCKLTVSFLVEAEAHHLPVALASMTAKYVRELMMLRLNRYFTGMVPELKPTAGYTEDARRYLSEIEPLISKLGVNRRALIRAL
jgi:ribonuclease HII